MKSPFFTRLYITHSSLLLHSSSDAMCEVKVQLGHHSEGAAHLWLTQNSTSRITDSCTGAGLVPRHAAV